MGRTITSSYVTIESVYESDDQIVFFVCWGAVPASDNHTLKLELASNGNILYSKTVENVSIHPRSFIHETIPLEEIRGRVQNQAQIKANLYIDEKLNVSQHLRYRKENIINDRINQAVILPFSEMEYKDASVWQWPKDSMELLRDSAADSIHCEVRRIIPNTIPHYVVEQKIGSRLRPDCFESEECINYLLDIYGKSLFIGGSMYVSRLSMQLCHLNVVVYNAYSGETRKYHSMSVNNKNDVGKLINQFIYDIVYKDGLQDDLIHM